MNKRFKFILLAVFTMIHAIFGQVIYHQTSPSMRYNVYPEMKKIDKYIEMHPTANFTELYSYNKKCADMKFNSFFNIIGDSVSFTLVAYAVKDSATQIYKHHIKYHESKRKDFNNGNNDELKRIVYEAINTFELNTKETMEDKYATIFLDCRNWSGKGMLEVYGSGDKLIASLSPGERQYYKAEPGGHYFLCKYKGIKIKSDFFNFKKDCVYNIRFSGKKEKSYVHRIPISRRYLNNTNIKSSPHVSNFVKNYDSIKKLKDNEKKRKELAKQKQIEIEKDIPRRIQSTQFNLPYTPMPPSAVPAEIQKLYAIATGFYNKDQVKYALSILGHSSSLEEYKTYRNYLYKARAIEHLPMLAKEIFGTDLPQTGSSGVLDYLFSNTSAIVPGDAQGLAHGYGSVKNSTHYFTGTFEHGHLKFGLLWTSHGQYIGTFKSGLKHGRGAYKETNSHNVSVGTYIEDKKNGFFIESNAAGIKFIGFKKEDYNHGPSVEFGSYPPVKYRIWKNGSKKNTFSIDIPKNGEFEIYYTDEYSKKQGIGLEVDTYKNYAVFYYLGPYVNGRRDGKWYKYFYNFDKYPSKSPSSYSFYTNGQEVPHSTVHLQSNSSINFGKAILGTVAFLGITNSNFTSNQKMQLGLSAAQDIINEDYSFSSTHGTLDEWKEIQKTTLDAYKQSAANVAAANTTSQPKSHSMILNDEHRFDGNKNEYVKSPPEQIPTSYKVTPKQSSSGYANQTSAPQSPTAAKVTSKLDDRDLKTAFTMVSGEGGPAGDNSKPMPLITTQTIFGGNHMIKIERFDTKGDGIKPNTKIYIKSSLNPGSRVKISNRRVQLINCTLSSGSSAYDVMSDYRSCFIVRAIDPTKTYYFSFDVDCDFRK